MLFPELGRYRRDAQYNDEAHDNNPWIKGISLEADEILITYKFPSSWDYHGTQVSLRDMQGYMEHERWVLYEPAYSTG